jgi:hypothetical protein
MLVKKELKEGQMKRLGETVGRRLCVNVPRCILIWILLLSALTQVRGQFLQITNIDPKDIKVGMYQIKDRYYSTNLTLQGNGFNSVNEIKFSIINTTYSKKYPDIIWEKGDKNWQEKVEIIGDIKMIIKLRVLSKEDEPGIYKWNIQLIGKNNQNASIEFTVRYIKHGIDKWLLDKIDELAGKYYNENWEISLNQYKAWIATITLEGSDGGYAAHSGAKNDDYFIHKDCKNFGFSTGIGPFQLDSIAIGNDDNVLNWTTLEKLGYSSYYKEICKNVVEFVLKFHKILFKDNVNLEYFAEKLKSIWYVLRIVKEVWERCTGERLG